MKLPTEHRKTKNKDKEKRIKEKKQPKIWDLKIPSHSKCRTFCATMQIQPCDMQVDQWRILPGNKVQRVNWRIQKTLHSWWKRGVAKPISNIDCFVKHAYGEHNQEADQWAKIGAQGRRKIVLDRRDDSTAWQAIRGFWDGSFKGNGRSGCGNVIKGVDRESG